MRNLKRVLSLTLASVMLLGVMVVGTSAKGYDDVDETYNVEAIEVLQAINVMAGDADTGNFRPDAPVTRGEMARIMAALLDLDYDYYVTAGIHPFNDMVGHWAEGYAAACKANGIIAGRTDTTYDPDAYVTAIEASSMMMRALGYFKYPAVDLAAGFEVATVAQGTKINLYDGVGSSASEPMTRNQVAQLALNTLEADLVEAVDNTLHITTGENAGSLNITGGQISYQVRTSQREFARAINKTTSEGGTDADGRTGSIIQLGEQLYNGDLKLEDDDTDVFGRPSRTWEYKTDVIGTYSIGETVEYTSGVKKSALYNLIGRTNYNRLIDPSKGWLHVTVNGCDDPAQGYGRITGETNINNYFNNASDKDANGTGTGVLTQVFLRDNWDRNGDGIADYSLRVDVVIVNTWVAQVSSEYNASRGSVRIDVLHDNAPSGTAIPNVSELTDDQFEGLEQLAEDDYLLFTYSDPDKDGKGEVESVEVASLLTGTVERYDTEQDNVTIDGDRYSYNASYVKADRPLTYGLGRNATVVMDQYGNIIWVDDSTGAQDYLYVYGLISSTGFADEGVARVVFPDGTMDEVTVEKLYARYKSHTKDVGMAQQGLDPDVASGYTKSTRYVTVTNNDGTKKNISEILLDKLPGSTFDANGYMQLDVRYNGSLGSADQFNGWYSYSVDNGKYTLVQAETDTKIPYSSIRNTSNGSLYNGLLLGETIEYGGSLANQYANNDTTFILVEDNDVTVYEGINNLPDIQLSTTGYVAAVKAEDGRDGNVYAGLVVIVDDDATVHGGTESMLYIIRKTDEFSEKSGETIYEYAAVVDGVETKIYAKSNAGFNVGVMYDKYTIDSNGYYKRSNSGDWRDTSDAKEIGHIVGTSDLISGVIDPKDGFITYKGGSLGLNGTYYIAADAEITLILVNTKVGSVDYPNAVVKEGVRHEVRENISANSLAGADNGYSYMVANWYGTVTADNGSVLNKLYVVITEAIKAP